MPEGAAGLRREVTVPAGTADLAAGASTGGAGAGAGGSCWGSGSGEAGTSRSYWPPSYAGSRGERRQRRKPAAAKSARAAAIHGHRGNRLNEFDCSIGADWETGADGIEMGCCSVGERPLTTGGGVRLDETACSVDAVFPGAPGVAIRSALRGFGARGGAELRAGGRTGAVCGRDGVTTAGWSAWRVTVPLRLKFCSSLGPMATGDVELVVAAGGGVGVCAGAVWAGAIAGATAKAAARIAVPARKIAFIRSRFSSERRSFPDGEQ